MAKKDFKQAINREKSIDNVVRQLIEPQAAVNAAATPTEPTENKKVNFSWKKNKVKTVSLRMTEEQYNKLLAKVEQAQANSVSKYILDLLERE